MVQGPRRMMRTILARVLLCTAFAVGEGHAQSKVEPDAERPLRISRAARR